MKYPTLKRYIEMTSDPALKEVLEMLYDEVDTLSDIVGRLNDRINDLENDASERGGRQ